ncbi:MAG: hypothetical protein LLF83_08500 [Methanobacterium sp.]|nr:hypothetical protein [Methanobacterium sp.]
MDDKGYAFTPMAFLLIIPVMVLAISLGGVIDELNAISAIVMGGDVTMTIASGIVKSIEQDTADGGRFSSMAAVQTVVNSTSLYYGNQPFFAKTGNNTTGNNSRAFIIGSTVSILNSNLTETCRVLERQTGRDIYINNIYVDPNGTNTLNIFTADSLSLTQSDPFGFYITVSSVPIKVVQKDPSGRNNQTIEFNTPIRNVYVSIEKLEDPWIWVMTKERNSSVIYKYPYYTSGSVYNSTTGDYHFADRVSNKTLNYLWECFNGPNITVMGPRSYYFPDPHGLSFFDRLENRTNDTSISPTSARMSTFIIYDVLQEEHSNNPTSMLDHEYFNGVTGYVITTTRGASVTNVIMPSGVNFLISTAYRGYLGLSSNYNY